MINKKLFQKYISKHKDVVYIVVLVFLILFAWAPLLSMIPRGNGYMYMLSHIQNWFWGRHYPLSGFSSAAAVSGVIFRTFFGADIRPYLWTELIVIMGTGVLFYWFVRVVTRKKIVAFAAALLFSVNYFGNFAMLISDCYCYFMERVLNVPFLIVSLIFLGLFFERKGIFLLLSLTFYFVGIGLGHFSFFFSGVFLFYPFFWYVIKGKKRTAWLTGARIGLSYLGITLFFLLIQQINESGFRSSWTFQEFLLNPQKYHYLEYMIRQLVYWSQYPPIVHSFFRVPFEHQNLVSVQNAISITPYVLMTYAIASIFIYKMLPQQRAMLFAVIFAAASNFYLNAYFGQYAIAYDAGSNRYLYFPTFLLAIFWSLFLWALCWKRNSWKVFIGVVILASYYLVNTTLISDNFRSVAEWNKPTKALYDYSVKTNSQREPYTLILGEYPAIKLQEAQFLTEMIGRDRVVYMSESLDMGDWRPFADKARHIIKLTYDRTCECVREERVK